MTNKAKQTNTKMGPKYSFTLFAYFLFLFLSINPSLAITDNFTKICSKSINPKSCDNSLRQIPPQNATDMKSIAIYVASVYGRYTATLMHEYFVFQVGESVEPLIKKQYEFCDRRYKCIIKDFTKVIKDINRDNIQGALALTFKIDGELREIQNEVMDLYARLGKVVTPLITTKNHWIGQNSNVIRLILQAL